MIHEIKCGKTITIKPKMMHIMAKMGLETVTPIFFKPFSTASAKHSHFRREISNNQIFNIFSNNELRAQIRSISEAAWLSIQWSTLRGASLKSFYASLNCFLYR
jgi:hypothetical protein